MVLRVKPTPTWFPTNSFYTPVDNTLLHSISSVCHPWGNGWRTRVKKEARNPNETTFVCFMVGLTLGASKNHIYTPKVMSLGINEALNVWGYNLDEVKFRRRGKQKLHRSFRKISKPLTVQLFFL